MDPSNNPNDLSKVCRRNKFSRVVETIDHLRRSRIGNLSRNHQVTLEVALPHVIVVDYIPFLGIYCRRSDIRSSKNFVKMDVEKKKNEREKDPIYNW